MEMVMPGMTSRCLPTAPAARPLTVVGCQAYFKPASCVKLMDTHIYNLQIRVLVYREDGEFAARALEMDLLGYGKTEREALEELKQAIQAQVSFAHQQGNPDLLNFPAEPEYFQRWEVAQRTALRSGLLGDKSVKLAARSLVLSFTPAEVKALRSRRFKEIERVCA